MTHIVHNLKMCTILYLCDVYISIYSLLNLEVNVSSAFIYFPANCQLNLFLYCYLRHMAYTLKIQYSIKYLYSKN